MDVGQRIGLLGRNGAGKTTLMRMLTGQVQPDAGKITFADEKTSSLLPQDVPSDLRGSLRAIVHQGRKKSLSPGGEPSWEDDHAVDQILSRMELQPDLPFESLSSGMKRRVLLARCLVSDPDLLLLDEPTNHLDVQAIEWLENFLGRWNGTLMFVTHDRMFLRKIANRILEIDRGKIFDWSCDYDTFLKRKEAALDAEEKQNALFDKKLAQEEAWIRQGIKARRTRNEGRVRALKAMRQERAERRERSGKVRLRIEEGQRSGTLVTEVKDLTFAYEDRCIVDKLSLTIERGDRVGIIGPNGAGKTTLLKLLLGEMEPYSGSVRTGTNLQVAYFDQLRDQLDENETVQENIGGGSDRIQIGDQSKHVLGYLQDFLFSPERARTPIRFLSGGERNRILLARLVTKPANVIVLDEPTNDLDAETLELLEERLVEYQGTLLVVSHDRAFLNHVVTSTLSFEDGAVKEYIGGFDDWFRQRQEIVGHRSGQQRDARSKKTAPGKSPVVSNQDAKSGSKGRKLKYKEQQELDGLPGKIESVEATLAELHTKMAEADFYQQPGPVIAAEQERLSRLESELAAAYQ
ncbi:MAG: ATP-binding cassette domain-containing protein, partial [Planctomycetota bacterium]|nr:ATP-binding cassette domain-containing protein [Planctomycetota bacterium]